MRAHHVSSISSSLLFLICQSRRNSPTFCYFAPFVSSPSLLHLVFKISNHAMTVNRDPAAANESSPVQNSSGSVPHKLNDFLSVNSFSGKKASDRENDRVLYGKLKACGEIETDQESTGSSEDMESPRSVVAKVRKWQNSSANKNVNLYVHSQILRIREEDSHLGEDIAENLSTGEAMDNNKLAYDDHHVDVWIFSHRPILPASPLSGKTIKSEFH